MLNTSITLGYTSTLDPKTHNPIQKTLEPCEDCVSRKGVHDMLENIPVTVENKWFNWLQMACIRLAELPPVTPERPKGEWIWKERTKGGFATYTGENTESGERVSVSVDERIKTKVNYCSVCGKRGDDTFFNFCPNCGADMRG